MGTIADKLNRLLQSKNDIREAIASKGQEVAGTVPFSGYAEKIRAIQTGPDTSDADATAGDILEGKTAYSGGKKVTGTIPVVSEAGETSVDTIRPRKQKMVIEKGYHAGDKTIVAAVANPDPITPTKTAQTISSDSAFMTSVTVDPIPDEYADVSGVTATAYDVLATKKIVNSSGELVSGTLLRRADTTRILDTSQNPSYTIPEGYHSGYGIVKIDPVSKTVTPSKETQPIIAPSGKVLQNVIVEPIPDAYQDVSAVTATASDVLSGKKIVDSSGAVVEGEIMPLERANVSLTPLKPLTAIDKGYYSNTSSVSVASKEVAVTPTKEQQVLTEQASFYSKVTVDPIPDNYIDTSNATATAGQILTGATAYVGGEKITGTMNFWLINKTFDVTITQTSTGSTGSGGGGGGGGGGGSSAPNITIPFSTLGLPYEVLVKYPSVVMLTRVASNYKPGSGTLSTPASVGEFLFGWYCLKPAVIEGGGQPSMAVYLGPLSSTNTGVTLSPRPNSAFIASIDKTSGLGLRIEEYATSYPNPLIKGSRYALTIFTHPF